MSKVAIVNAKKENLTAFDAAKKAFLKVWSTPINGDVFIKPNIGATSHWVNTDPEIVRGIIHCVRSFGAREIIVGDGSVETEYESAEYNFRHGGWNALAAEEKIKLVDLNHEERIKIPWHYGSLMLPKILFGKLYINVAKIKTHMQTLVSLCAKNQKGLLDSTARKIFHKYGLHRPIAELANIIRPDVCILDGIVAVEGNGPGELGNKKDLGLVISSKDMLLIDMYCCQMMGICASQVKHLKLMFKQNKQEKCTALFSYNTNPYFVERHIFKLPSKELNMYNVHMRPENACSACMSSVGKMNKLARKSLKGIWYFLKRGIFSRLDIVIGSPEELPENHGYCIFYGDCAKEIAARYPEYPLFKGCPPVSKKVLEELS